MANENLNKKLLELQKSVRGLAKNQKAYGYDYVTGSKLLSFVRPKMDELGLRLVPNTISVGQELVETVPQATQRDGSIKPAKKEVLVLLHKTFTWVDVESGETETTDFFSQGCNGFDKAIGSAETYAERYFLLKYFHIATDEDDVDAIHNEPAEETAEPSPEKPTKKGAKSGASAKQVEGKPEQVGHGDDDIFDDVALQDAIEAAKNAATQDELTKVWKDWKPRFGTYAEFVNAVKNNPNHPSHKKEGE